MRTAIETYRYTAPDDPAEAPPPLKSFPAGARLVVAFNRTRRKVSLIDLGTLRHARVDVGELRFAEPAPVAPSRIKRHLRRRVALFKKHQLRFPRRAVRAVIKAL